MCQVRKQTTQLYSAFRQPVSCSGIVFNIYTQSQFFFWSVKRFNNRNLYKKTSQSSGHYIVNKINLKGESNMRKFEPIFTLAFLRP